MTERRIFPRVVFRVKKVTGPDSRRGGEGGDGMEGEGGEVEGEDGDVGGEVEGKDGDGGG